VQQTEVAYNSMLKCLEMFEIDSKNALAGRTVSGPNGPK
jgi:hypothetical protein